MSDLIGQTVGHYRIVDKIGEGGMGEVYRARDERLDRDVAVKVLHEAVAQDADRLARFEREAKAVAKLDHPNILAIHDFGTEDGVTYAVTELLDGRDLRHAIPASGMPWQKVVDIGAAIADGLAAAHGKGVFHRDLKPENVFITADGRVKVLDFGLARVKEPVEEEAETATLTPAGTVAGTVMGTLGYMSPEQLRGEPADARSDIFAHGCVLYEMLSGRAAFLRNSTAETTAAILKEEPERLSSTGSALPAELERTIHRCLEKSPDARYQSAADLAFNLRSIGTGPAVPITAASTDSADLDGGAAGPRALKFGLIAAGLVFVAAASWWALTQRAADDQVSSRGFRSMTIEPVTSLGTVGIGVAISPDGRQVAYVRREAGQYAVWVRQVATGSEVAVVEPQENPVTSLIFAPDGEHVFFNSWDNGAMWSIYRVPTLGGEVRRIVPNADSAPSFSPDGQHLVFRRGLPGRGVALMVANIDGSDERELAIGNWMASPSWSPNGRTIAALLAYPEGSRFSTFDVDRGTRQDVAADIVFTGSSGVAWDPDGEHLIVAGSISGDAPNHQIFRLSASTGNLERVTNDPNHYSSVGLSADGNVLATVLTQAVAHLYVAPAGEPHDLRQLTRGSRELVGAVDSDGGSAVFQRAADGQEWGIWTCEHDGSKLRRLNTDGLEIVPGLWGISAIGGEVLFTARGADRLRQIWRLDENEESLSEITKTENGAYGPSLSPDRSWFVYTAVGATGMGSIGSHGVWRQSLGGGSPVLLSDGATLGVVSPEGEKVAFEVWRWNDRGEYQDFLEVVSAEGSTPLMSVFLGSDSLLRWKPDGQALTYFQRGELWCQALDGRPPEQLTHFDDGRRTISHAWSSDGQWLYLVRRETTSDVVLIRDF